jgi:hypothetical protein
MLNLWLLSTPFQLCCLPLVCVHQTNMHYKYGEQDDIIVMNIWFLPLTHNWSRIHMETKFKIYNY